MSFWKRLLGTSEPPNADSLLMAAELGDLARIKKILRNAPDSVFGGVENRYGRTALHGAADKANADIARLLLISRANVNAEDSQGNTPLHLAVASAQVLSDEVRGTVELLLASGAAVNAKNSQGNTPLHLVGRAKKVAELLLARKADVEAVNNTGVSPLHTAVIGGCVGVARLLLARGANVDSSLINLAALRTMMFPDKGMDELVELLSARSASEGAEAAHEKSPHTPTLICGACGRSYRIGDDAVAIALEFAFGLARRTVVASDGAAPAREDLVDYLYDPSDGPPENVGPSREKARQNWELVQDSLSRGHRRTWRCRACAGINLY